MITTLNTLPQALALLPLGLLAAPGASVIDTGPGTPGAESVQVAAPRAQFIYSHADW